MDAVVQKPKKSVSLTRDELKKLRRYVKGQSQTKAALSLGVGREVLLRVLLVGSGSEETINILRNSEALQTNIAP